jgi:uncharacterized damage-inducible protein DinB
VRTAPTVTGPELQRLVQFLDFQRQTVLLKTDGLTRDQMNQPLPPSTLTLGGLLNHLALVEDSWFSDRFAGNGLAEPWASVDWTADPDWEFHQAATMDADELRAAYLRQIERSNEIVAGADIEQLSARGNRDGVHWDLRWVMLHMIEETARHAGHADLLREAIDGTTGE